jgi:hypothetical protein
MPLDLEILQDRYQTGRDSLKALFTAQPGDLLHDKRRAVEERIQSRVHEGVRRCLENYQFTAALDLAWDGPNITKELVPITLYAQKKITFSKLKDSLKDLSDETKAQFCKYDDHKNLVGVDLPALLKVSTNLVRSLITKRTAAIASRYVRSFPLFSYEPRGTSFVAKLKADVLSQRVDAMTDAYGYRHDLTQSIREMLLYPFSIEFPVCAWDRDTSVRKKVVKNGLQPEKDYTIESYITREGVPFHRPHPTKVFHDPSHPLSSLNTDTGCNYVGYWQVMRFGDVKDDGRYWNRSSISFDRGFAAQFAAYSSYFEIYSNRAPSFNSSTDIGVDVAGANDRERNVGLYTSEDKDRSLMVTNYFEKVVPKEVGFGTYDRPVWVRYVVAADYTVLFAEIVPYTPATVFQYNCHDGKLLNNSFGHEVAPFGDLVNNMLANLLLVQKTSMIRVITADVDLLGGINGELAENVKKLREQVKGEGLYAHPLYLEVKGSQAQEMGQDPRRAVTITEAQAIQSVQSYFDSLFKILSLAERMLGTSANESAQSEPRQISATESQTISNTVGLAVGFASQGVDEAVAAKKKLLYEAMLAFADNKVFVPVVNRYQSKTIRAAGFDIVNEDQEGEGVIENYVDDRPRRYTVTGDKTNLVYEYTFTSRDGAERPSNPKAAEVLVQLVAQLAQMPGVLQDMGKEQLHNLLNAIVRLSGVGVDMKFEAGDGEGDQINTGDPTADSKDQVNAAIAQITDAIQQDRQKMAELEMLVKGAQQPPPMQ